MDYFITTYFNVQKCNIRKKLALEFSHRYSNVIFLVPSFESSFEVINKIVIKTEALGFIDYVLINAFIKSVGDIKTLTIIDSDLIVPDGFFGLISSNCNSYKTPVCVQGYKTCYELKDSEFISYCNSDGYNNSRGFSLRGHSGYIWCYNKLALDIIGQFPESFTLGGFDYVLCLCLRGEIDKLNALVKNSVIEKDSLSFYHKIEDFNYDYINAEIVHNFHGYQKDRLTDWKKYKDLFIIKKNNICCI